MVLGLTKLEEAGYSSAMVGLALNKNQNPGDMMKVAVTLAPKGLGHNKFLEHIVVWFMVKAPRYWWQDADTYRLSSKQSESTNHTIMKRHLTKDDFEDGDIDSRMLKILNDHIDKKQFRMLKKKLPEGFLQTREWMMSYKTLQNIIQQRSKHKLQHWKVFIEKALHSINDSELVTSGTPQMSRAAVIKCECGENVHLTIGANFMASDSFVDKCSSCSAKEEHDYVQKTINKIKQMVNC